ncbi:conserved hypothetical protein [Candida tropicalis MYA-3404]|uniref:TRIP4/RQT4 C2HC5-type zinc finger domain-containing protein n=1 Tax=Candida tropicalis (strain ATCC MYA-3404 / T1) TaxID=294747 RepID=C5M3X8_CANTT|nr:conserved hypothetical protein [Candida tropicalis MYA-3404]EER36028.1 conserved hypothetical protein [Candida tropicalis MYA-3404]KAG4410146.1 hypothetical protein JTP64_000784 [Candida tropicalis]
MSRNKSTTTSQLLKSKSTSPDPVDKQTKKKNLVNLQDIETILNELETNDSATFDTSVRRVCNCMARRHPLFEIAPNCLNCGKIICTKEGMQPCSFCGADIIPAKDKDAIIKLLEQEKQDLANRKQQADVPTQKKTKKKIVVKMNTGEKFWEAQDRAFKLAEEELRKTREAESIAKEEQSQNPKKSDADLERAKERLETLLDYQATGAERTRIIDNASDFEMPSQSLWLTPEERALNLKKQQRLMRENQFNRDRKSRGERTVEMSIKDGKVTMIEKFVSHKEDISTDEKQLEDTIKEKKQQAANANDSIWDYDKDRLKWEKPIYFTTGDSPKPIESNELQIKNRVQFSKEDASDLIATLIN